MPISRTTPEQRAARRRQRAEAAAADAARLSGTVQDEPGIQWQKDPNPLNRETYWATNGLPQDHPSYTVVHVVNMGDGRWLTRTWVGENREIRVPHPSPQAAQKEAEAALASPPTAHDPWSGYGTETYGNRSWLMNANARRHEACGTFVAPGGQADHEQTCPARRSAPSAASGRDPAKPCGKRRSDGGRCRNVGDCPHHP